MDLGTPTFGGEVHPAYDNPRAEVTRLVPTAATRVLDVGCSTGAMGAALKARGHAVTGLEFDAALAATARERLDHVVEGDVEQLAATGAPLDGPFDCIVFADVLEHLRDPWAVVRWAAPHVAPGGSIVISVPNVRHAKTFWTLLVRRRWPYDPVGIFDRTHLRFFARRNLAELVEGTGFEVVTVERHAMLVLKHTSPVNRLARFLGDLGTLQFVFRAERPA